MCCMLMEYQTYACWAWQCKRCCHLILDIKQDLLWGFVADLYCFTEQPSGARKGKLRQGGEVKRNEAKFYLKFSRKKKMLRLAAGCRLLHANASDLIMTIIRLFPFVRFLWTCKQRLCLHVTVLQLFHIKNWQGCSQSPHISQHENMLCNINK